MHEEWGKTDNGGAILRVELMAGDLSASVMSLGASLVDLRLKGHPFPLVLGYCSPSIYRRDRQYMGAAIGRLANRVAQARFTLDGKTHHLEANEGPNCLHGGADGFHKRNWTLEESGDDHAIFSLISPDGDMGFPGRVRVSCRYQLSGDAVLTISLHAQSDAPTLCAMTTHSYFNLADGGATPINAHRLQVHADHYLPTDGQNLPTGDVAPVDGTPFDLRTIGEIGPRQIDHNLCLADSAGDLREVANLAAPGGPTMTLSTTEPGLQFYTGDKLNDATPGLDGIVYGARSGLCLEPQAWPDSARHRHFPSARLDPGETRTQVTRLSFS
jgi:aldose 1-epimerase